MPLTELTEEQQKVALASASSDLKFHLAEKGVPQKVQIALFHAGFTNLHLFAGMDESRTDVRGALAAEIGLKHDEDTPSRIAVASVLAAWESSRLQATTEEKLKVESRLGQSQRGSAFGDGSYAQSCRSRIRQPQGLGSSCEVVGCDEA